MSKGFQTLQKKSASSTPVRNQFQSRPFVVQTKSVEVSPQQEAPEIQEKQETKTGVGFDFGRIQVLPRIAVQRKHFVGEKGDKYEKDADHVASQVVREINAPETLQRQSVDNETRVEQLAQTHTWQITPQETSKEYDKNNNSPQNKAVAKFVNFMGFIGDESTKLINQIKKNQQS